MGVGRPTTNCVAFGLLTVLWRMLAILQPTFALLLMSNSHASIAWWRITRRNSMGVQRKLEQATAPQQLSVRPAFLRAVGGTHIRSVQF